MTPHWTRDLCIWHCTEWRNVGLVICASDIVQNDAMLDLWSVHLTLYRMTPCWTRDLIASFCTMSDAQITSPTWRHSVQCQMHRSQVQHGVILYNVRCTDHESKYLTLYRMTPCWTCDLCIWHYTEWIHVGLVICVSDIIQNGFMLALWSCIWHYTEWCHVGLMTCLSNIIQNDATLDSWSVYLTLYRMTQCWTRDLCIWHCTEWRHVGLVISLRHPV